MTISYQRDVASSTAGGFTRLLFKWKGSLYKLIYRELLLFLSAYILLSLTYRKLLNKSQRDLFEMVVKYFDAFLNLVPLSFVLGFYVSYVAGRWWQQFLAIPWPDKLFHSIACFVEGFDEESRILRRSLMRYMNLALILVLRSISSAVKQRFPTLDHVVEAGFMTNQEKELFQVVPCNEFNTYWIPCTWFVYRIQEAAKKGKLLNDYAIETIMREFCEFRSRCGLLWCYDWVSIPMVYTQVVTLATYVFFIFTVIGRQKLDGIGIGEKPERMQSGRLPMSIDLYIPVYTVLQFFFYMGLLKVAEQLINPFGDDDEDFELNWLVDRHMKASFLGCDILMDPDRIPPMVKDYYWDKQNCPIPYTEASMHFKRKTYRGSAAEYVIPESKQHMVLPEIEEEADDPSGRRASKLSLTSLLLDSTHLVTGISNPSIGNTQTNNRRSLPDGGVSSSYNQINERRTPKSDQLNYHPGSWRNGAGPAPSEGGNGFHQTGPSGTTRGADQLLNKSDTRGAGAALLAPPDIPLNSLRRTSEGSLPWGTSVSAESGSDEELEDSTAAEDGAVGTGNGTATDGASDANGERRGSIVKDITDKKKKGEKRRRKPDKQGFVWRRMIHDQEDLPRQRTPSLGLGAAPYLNQPMGVENPRGRPSVVTSPQSAPPNISLMPPTPNKELSEEAAALLSQKPPPPTPVSAPATASLPHSLQHRPTPQQRFAKTSQASTRDNTLQQLQMQVPSGIASVAMGRKSPAPEHPISHRESGIDNEQPPPLVPIDIPNSTTVPQGYTKEPQVPQYNVDQRMVQPRFPPQHSAARPATPAFAPRQGSAPPRFTGPRPPPQYPNGAGDIERVRSSSASSGPPLQPVRKGSGPEFNIGGSYRPNRSRSAADEPMPGSLFQPISSEASIPKSTLRQNQLKQMSDTYDSRDSNYTDRSSSVDKASGKGKRTKLGKSEQEKSDEAIRILKRSNAYAAEKPSSPQRASNAKPGRSDVGLIPQPFGTPRSPPVSSNTLESAQRQMTTNPQLPKQGEQ